MMIHDDPLFALWFFFHSWFHEVVHHPGKFLPALIIASMLAYIGSEFVRAHLRRRRRLAVAAAPEPPQDIV
ncbi:hypothetical protein [Bradyrhizobium sp. Ce-3]|uniref:hypothetical protein n=1 Tax=Bradyrhizobium sp. Ce-3 TaxID=2913970 RepID=UPI001FC87C02|nr:hypothetical protein [Bradyrhizobium sp. Ce-3]